MYKLMLPMLFFFSFSIVHAQLTFENVTTTLALNDAGNSAVIWFDYNNDGALDLLVNGNSESNANEIHLLLNQQGHFMQTAQQANLPASSAGATWGDFDNDGHTDLFFAGWDQPNKFYRNKGNGTFEDITQQTGITTSGAVIITSSFVDYDNNGLLDLYLGNYTGADYLFRNNGDGTFTNISDQAGLTQTARNTTYHMFADYNNDGLMDLFVCSLRNIPFTYQSFSQNQLATLYKNNGNGTFSNVTQQTGIEYENLDVNSVLFLDHNNDGWLDLFLSTWGNDRSENLLYKNLGDGTFRNIATIARVTGKASSRSVVGGDFDNDGWIDMYVGNDGFDFDNRTYTDQSKYSNHLFINNADETFSQHATTAGISDQEITFNVGTADYDGDGFLDIYAANSAVANRNTGIDALYRNLGNNNNWLHIDLIGVQSNRSAIGAKIILTSGDLTMIREIRSGHGYGGESFTAEFGLGTHTQADQIEIRWPSGQIDILSQITANQRIRILEGQTTYQVIRPLIWAHTLPKSIALNSPFNAGARIQAEPFDPTATITQVTLTGLRKDHTITLKNMGNNTFHLDAQNLFLTEDLGQRQLIFQIEQTTSIGAYVTTFPVLIEATQTQLATIVITQEQINFGEIDLDTTGRSTLTIQNTGTGVLTIQEIRTNIPHLTWPTDEIVILPEESYNLSLTYFPQAEGAFSGQIELVSNNTPNETTNLTVSGTVLFVPGNPKADFNNNGQIDFPDFLIFAQAFGSTNTTTDLNENGTVDFPDFLLFAKTFGKSIN